MKVLVYDTKNIDELLDNQATTTTAKNRKSVTKNIIKHVFVFVEIVQVILNVEKPQTFNNICY